MCDVLILAYPERRSAWQGVGADADAGRGHVIQEAEPEVMSVATEQEMLQQGRSVPTGSFQRGGSGVESNRSRCADITTDIFLSISNWREETSPRGQIHNGS
jgi:hypothetical protein